MRITESKTYKKTIKRTALTLAALYALIAVWLIYTGDSLFLLLGETIFLAALLIWLMVMLPGTRYRSKYKAMTGGGDSVPERTVIFYKNQLSVTANSGKETVIPYENITGWQETKHLYILKCNNNACVLLDKKGFISGDFQVITMAISGNKISEEKN